MVVDFPIISTHFPAIFIIAWVIEKKQGELESKQKKVRSSTAYVVVALQQHSN